MRTHRSLVIAAVAAALCVAAAGCGSSGKSNASATTTTAAPTTTVPATTTTTFDQTQAKTNITNAFVSFLNSADPNFDARVALIQDGASIKSLFVQLEQANSKVASTGQVTDIEFMTQDDCSSNVGFNGACAAVTYNVLVSGKVALSASKGYAVLDSGTWKVARQTFCALAGLANVKCPAS